jgi:hypothetical protein
VWPFQPADVPFDDLQALLFVTGDAAEEHLRGDVVQVVAVAADPPVRVPVGLRGLFQPAGVQVAAVVDRCPECARTG